MATAENAKLELETGQTLVAYTEMTDSGDHQIFTVSGGTIWSGKSGYTPVIRPDGMVEGRNVLSIHASNDTVTVAAFSAYSKGTEYDVAATTDTFTRPATASKAKIYSITMASDGNLAVVAGTISADTTFSETRNAAGGPPYIPQYSVEIGQLRVTSSTAAPLTAAEIFQVPGTHSERFDYPVWDENNIGDGDNAEAAAQKNAYIKFASVLPAIHAAGTYKSVWIQYYTPIFSKVAKCVDFVPADQTHSVTSKQIYGGTLASRSKALGQGGFTAFLSDGVTDALIREQDYVATTKYYPDENKAPYVLTQGALGLARSFPVDDQVQADVTISAESKSANFTS